MLKVKSNAASDTSITSMQYHAYNPYTTTFSNNDEVRISIQQQDLYLLPHDSFIFVEGTVVRSSAAAATAASPTWNGNQAYFLFSEIRYELNGIEIDCCKQVGTATVMKGYASFSRNNVESLKLTSFGEQGAASASFSYCIPLSHILGFAEDYQRIVMNMKHELILVRSRNDIDCFYGDNNILTINVTKIQWRMPHVKVDDYTKLQLLKHIDDKQSIQMNFRKWDLYEYPTLPQTQKNIWAIKTSSNLQKPRYVIFGLQTNRNAQINRRSTQFDHCNLSQVKLYLNSDCYPYENSTVHFGQAQPALLYHAYSKFQETYYHDRSEKVEPYLTPTVFTASPLIVFDCSRQPESIKNSLVDVRLEIETRENIPANTRAFCMIIHDHVISYNPFTSIVNKTI
jgi:hypothetical protein